VWGKRVGFEERLELIGGVQWVDLTAEAGSEPVQMEAR
jgi:hypothetical protein